MRNAAWLGLLVVSACTVVPAQSAAARKHVVKMSGFEYQPAALQVSAGDTVIFTNGDAVPHTATATDQAWNTGQVAPGEQGMWIATATGDQSYYCIFHPTMKAKLVVR